MQNRISFDDIFTPETEEQVSSREKEMKEVAEEAEAVGKLARECINTDKFQQYKHKFEETKEKLINAILNYKDQDGNIERYGFQVAIYLERVRMLGALLTAVENDSRKGKQ